MNTQMSKLKYHHGQLKEKLLGAALDLLEQEGIANLSLRKLSKIVGVSHNAPYRHFSDKSELLACLVQIGFERLSAAIDAAGRENPDDVAQYLLDAGVAYIQIASRSPVLFQLMFGGLTVKEAKFTEVKAAANRAYDKLFKIIALGKTEGVFKTYDTTSMTLAAWALVHGVATLHNSGYLNDRAPSKKAPAEMNRLLPSMLLKGLLK